MNGSDHHQITALSFFREKPSNAVSSAGFLQPPSCVLKQPDPSVYPYRKLQKLGLGSYGTAYKAKCLSK
jgi:hypothetical protein